MGSMKLDIDGIADKVKLPLNYSIRDIDSSIGIISSISIPNDFIYGGTLRNCSNILNETKQKIDNIYNWANSVAVKFQQAEQRNASILNAISGSITAASMIASGAKAVGRKIESMSKQKISGTMKNVKNVMITGAEIATDKCQSIYQNTKETIDFTKAKIEEKAESLLHKMQKAVSEKVEQIKDLTTKTLTDINLVASKMADKCENFYKAEIAPRLEKIVENTKAEIADRINISLSLLKGLGQFIESLVDLVGILGTVAGTVVTGVTDAVNYLYSKATGTSDDWESATAKMWKETMSFVAEDHVGNAFKSFYENTIPGQWLDENAHEWFKSDGTISEIVSGIGYIGGVVLLSMATLGVGGVAVGTASSATMATTTATVAGLSATGKYTAEYWEKARDSSWEGIEEMYQNGEIDQETYTSFQQIRNLSDEEWEAITAEYQKGNISQEEYEKIKQIREIPEDWTTFENGAKGLGYGVANGAWEGIQFYAGGKLAGWTMKSGSKIATSAVRVAADTGFNALDTPFRTTVDTITSDQSWKEAWESQGGWTSVLTNIGVGLIGSIGGEVIDLKNADVSGAKETQNGVYGKKVSKEPIKLNNETEIAIFFNDPKGFLCDKFNLNPKGMSIEEIYKYANQLSPEDANVFQELLRNQRIFTEEESRLLEAFSYATGPVYSAKLRGTDVQFQGATFKGNEGVVINTNGVNIGSLEDYIKKADNIIGKQRNFVNIENDIAVLDNIIEKSPPLQQSIIVSRNVDSIFYDGDQLLTFNVGDKFNDKGYFSTSVDSGNHFKNRKIKLEIEIPEGTKAAYIQPTVSERMTYGQQELLLGRNNSYQIIDLAGFDSETGQIIIKAKLLNDDSIISKTAANSVNSTNSATKYYNNYENNIGRKQLDLSDIISEMKEKELLGKYEAEVRDIKMSGLYKDTVPEHGLEHVENVLFNAMYIGNKEGLTDNELKILTEAAKFHDCGKEISGATHGIQGAQNAEYYLSMVNDEKNISAIQAAIEYHAIPDNVAELNKIFDKYNISGENRASVEKIANILKDADALDRSRFPGNLNENYLRTDISKNLIKTSYQLQELRGKTYLDNYNGSADAEKTIQILKDNGISDYEISFWIKNRPDSNGNVMPIWNKVNLKMQGILKGLGG